MSIREIEICAALARNSKTKTDLERAARMLEVDGWVVNARAVRLGAKLLSVLADHINLINPPNNDFAEAWQDAVRPNLPMSHTIADIKDELANDTTS